MGRVSKALIRPAVGATEIEGATLWPVAGGSAEPEEVLPRGGVAMLKFVRYRPEFEAAVVELHEEAMGRFMDESLPPHEMSDLHSIPETYVQGGGEFLVGLLGEEVVAMGGYRRDTPTSAELKRMRIRARLHGRGFGSELLAELERIAAQDGITELTLETAQERPATLEFYRGRGYIEDGTNRYGDVETLKFKKKLAE